MQVALRDAARAAGFDLCTRPGGLGLVEVPLAQECFNLDIAVSVEPAAGWPWLVLEVICSPLLKLQSRIAEPNQEMIHTGLNVLTRPVLFYCRQQAVHTSLIQLVEPSIIGRPLLEQLIRWYDRAFRRALPLLRSSLR